MRVSKRTDYALRALMMLVGRYGLGPVSIREISEQNEVPRRFLEQILQELKLAEVVNSIPGRTGGFVLARPPEEITLGQIVRRFDGVLSPIHCVSSAEYESCSQEVSCRFRRLMLEIRNYTLHALDQASLAVVYRSQPVLADEVFPPQFIEGDGI